MSFIGPGTTPGSSPHPYCKFALLIQSIEVTFMEGVACTLLVWSVALYKEFQCSHVQSVSACSISRCMCALLCARDWVNYHQESFCQIVLCLIMPEISYSGQTPNVWTNTRDSVMLNRTVFLPLLGHYSVGHGDHRKLHVEAVVFLAGIGSVTLTGLTFSSSCPGTCDFPCKPCPLIPWSCTLAVSMFLKWVGKSPGSQRMVHLPHAQ